MTGISLEPLPRGRHKLSAETVSDSQRRRLIAAMVACVGERGYADTTVPQVVALARTSRSAFYAHFADKAECFVAMVDEHSEELLSELIALAARPDWIAALREGVDRYLQSWQEQPDYCRAFFVELPAAGERALAARDRAFERFGAMFAALAAWARHADPQLPPLRPRTVDLLVFGVTELIAQEWRAGRVNHLEDLRDDIVDHALRMLADERTANDALA